jgi:hypothetical protein
MRTFAIAAILAILSSCAPEKPEIVAQNRTGDDARVAVVVGSESFSVDEVMQRIDAMPEWAKSRFATTERKKTFLATTVQFELLHDEAQRLGYDTHPDTIHRLEIELADAWIREQVAAMPVTDDDLRAHFDAHLEDFRRGTARKTYVLQTFTAERAEELRARILEAPPMERAARFQEVATNFSLDYPSRIHAGAVGAIARDGELVGYEGVPGRLPDDTTGDFLEVPWRLDESEVSEPIEMNGRALLVMWQGVLPAEDVELEDVSESVREHLVEARRAELLASFAE